MSSPRNKIMDIQKMNKIFTGKKTENKIYGYSKPRIGFPPIIRYNYIGQDWDGGENRVFLPVSVPILRCTKKVWRVNPSDIPSNENVVMGRVIGKWAFIDDLPPQSYETEAQQEEKAKRRRAVKRLSKISLSSSDSYDSSLARYQAGAAEFDYADNPPNPETLDGISENSYRRFTPGWPYLGSDPEQRELYEKYMEDCL